MFVWEREDCTGCDNHKTEGIGEKPLTDACKGGNEKIMQLLIDKRCNVNQPGGIRQRPLTILLIIDKGCYVH